MKLIVRPQASSLSPPHFLLPDASLSWQSYRASEAAMGRETTRREKRFREGQMASWPQANDQHRLFRKRLLAFSRRLQDGLNNFTQRRSWNLCWYHSLPPTCDWQQGSDASLVWCVVQCLSSAHKKDKGRLNASTPNINSGFYYQNTRVKTVSKNVCTCEEIHIDLFWR